MARRTQRLELKRAQRAVLSIADEQITKRIGCDRHRIIETRTEPDAIAGARARTAHAAGSGHQARVRVDATDNVIVRVAHVRALSIGQQRNAARPAEGRARAYAVCVQTGQCDIHDPRVIGYTRMLAKIPEHTYGFPGLDDSTHFTNDDFHSIIAAGEQAYVDCLHSYTEQRDIAAREGMRYLADHPLAANITARMAAIAPAVPDVSQLTPVDQGDWATAVSITTPGGALTLGFDGTTGAFTTFNLAGVDWADEGHLLAQYIYKTYNGGSLSQRLVLTFPAPHPSPSSRNPALATRRRLTSFCLLPHHRRRQQTRTTPPTRLAATARAGARRRRTRSRRRPCRP